LCRVRGGLRKCSKFRTEGKECALSDKYACQYDLRIRKVGGEIFEKISVDFQFLENPEYYYRIK
jgi:hypothetical protein